MAIMMYKTTLYNEYNIYQQKFADDLRKISKTDSRSFWKILNSIRDEKKMTLNALFKVLFKYSFKTPSSPLALPFLKLLMARLISSSVIEPSNNISTLYNEYNMYQQKFADDLRKISKTDSRSFWKILYHNLFITYFTLTFFKH
jgi:ribosomal protein L18E